MALPGPRPSRANLSAATSGPRRGVPPAPIPVPVPSRNAGNALRPGVKASGIQSAAPAPAAPRKNVGSALRPGAKASGIRTAAPSPDIDPAESDPRPARPAIRKKVAPRRSYSGGGNGLMRGGISVAVVVLILVAKFALFRPSTNQNYFNKMADLDHRITERSFENPKALRAQIEALPISGVTDAKLREYHELILKFVDAFEKEDGAKALALAPRMEKLLGEINATYARR